MLLKAHRSGDRRGFEPGRFLAPYDPEAHERQKQIQRERAALFRSWADVPVSDASRTRLARFLAKDEHANHHLKRSFRSRVWGSILLATAVHAALFVVWPTMTVEATTYAAAELETVRIPSVEIPPPPPDIDRPAVPVVSTLDVDEDITIPVTTFEGNPVVELPPPPEKKDDPAPADAPVFTPYSVAPQLLNEKEIRQAMESEYPPLLRDAGIDGTVYVVLFVDEAGTVRDSRVGESSGHEKIDQAALRVADQMRFRPAQYRDLNVPVWIRVPITFTVGRDA